MLRRWEVRRWTNGTPARGRRFWSERSADRYIRDLEVGWYVYMKMGCEIKLEKIAPRG